LRIAKQQQREPVVAIDAQSNPNEFVNASWIGSRPLRRTLILKRVPFGRIAPIKRALRFVRAGLRRSVLGIIFQENI
jgi:hypothetical protein